MIKDLLDLPIEKRPTTLTFEGRILYLLDDAELMKAQLYEGTDVGLTAALEHTATSRAAPVPGSSIWARPTRWPPAPWLDTSRVGRRTRSSNP